MNEDKKMYFIRNKDCYRKGEDFITCEYEVTVNAYIVGEFNYEPYSLLIWEFSPKSKGAERKLILRIKETFFWDKLIQQDSDKSSKSTSFYHGGGIADEIISLASLFLRRRLNLGQTVRMGDKPMMIDISSDNIGYKDNSLIEGKSDLKDLADYFNLVENLKPRLHLKFILATKFYHQALLVIESYPDIAYLNLISSIEVLCVESNIGEVKISEVDKELAGYIEQIANVKLRKEIGDAILKREHFIKRHFINFIMDNGDDEFWVSSDSSEFGKINKDDLPDILSRIYNQRSKTLHEGEPFPPDIFLPPADGVEIGPGLSMKSRGKVWEKEDFIPYPHFFERLVRHVLINFLRKNQVD